MFIRNAWYVAGWSDEFTAELTPLTILGDRIVFYRTPSGTPAALEDACPHRRLPLSMGRLQGDAVECGYHGLTFNPQGQCVKAPTQPGTIPVRAKVRSYPVEDRYGLLWIWMGDAGEASTDDILRIDNFENPSWGQTPGGHIDIDCNYLYIADNLLDPYHVAWVHQSSFAGAGTDTGAPETEVLPNGVLVSKWVLDQPPPPYYQSLLPFSGHCDRLQHYECVLPSTAINKSVYTPAGEGGPDYAVGEMTYINISYNFMTPVDENQTRYFWFQHRNTDPNNREVSQQMFDGAKMAFNEDKEVLVAVHRGIAENPDTIALHLDGGANRFRLLVEQQIRQESQASV